MLFPSKLSLASGAPSKLPALGASNDIGRQVLLFKHQDSRSKHHCLPPREDGYFKKGGGHLRDSVG